MNLIYAKGQFIIARLKKHGMVCSVILLKLSARSGFIVSSLVVFYERGIGTQKTLNHHTFPVAKGGSEYDVDESITIT